MAQADYKLIVAPGAFDDLGKVLKDLGYKYETKSLDSLSQADLKNCRVVFVSCAAALSNQSVKEYLLQFVANGGAIYVSDLSYSVLEQLFPGKISFANVEYNSKITGEIVDSGLREVIGKSINLHMDYTSAAGINSVSREVDVLIQGQRVSSSKDKYPFLASFKHGDGQVVYTVFHNSHQVSDTEKKLLNYLIFRPIMSGAASKAAQLVQAQMATPGKEIFASINPGETSARYGVNVTSPINLLFVLSWEENATLGMQVWDPSGKLVKDAAVGKSPLTIEVPASQTGTWTCAVNGQTVPHRNFPYVLTIATRSGKLAAPAPSAATSSTSATQKRVPVYLLVDTSNQAKDVLNPLMVGLRQFEMRIRSRAYREYSPSLSLIAVKDSAQILARDLDASQYTTPSMSSQGSCNLGQGLSAVLSSIASARADDTKPLIIALLCGSSSDDFIKQAEQLRDLAVKGKANIFVFGLGGFADAGILSKLTTSTPLAVPVLTQVYAQQIFDWLYNILDVILTGIESGAGGQKKSIPQPPACVRAVQ